MTIMTERETPLFTIYLISALLVVYPDGHGLYPNVQAAVDASMPDDEIVLAQGIFTGPGNQNVQIQRRINLRSENPSNDSSFRPDSRSPEESALVFYPSATGSTIHDVGFQDAPGGLGAVCISGASVSFTDIWFLGNGGGGIHMSMSNSTITRGIFEENHSDFGAGVYVDSGFPTITDCSFVQNSVSQDGGAVYMNSGHMTSTTFVRNYAKRGGAVVAGPGAIIENCSINGWATVHGGAAMAYGGAIFRQCGIYGEAPLGPAASIRSGVGCVTFEHCSGSPEEWWDQGFEPSPYYIESGCVDTIRDEPTSIAPMSWGKIKGGYR